MVNAPMSTAVAASPGTPSVSIGRRSPPVLPFSAVWAAATPSGAPLPNRDGSFDGPLGLGIGQEARCLGADAGRDADDQAVDAGTQVHLPHARDLHESRQHVADGRRDGRERCDLLHLAKGFREREEPDHHGDEVETSAQFGVPEIQPLEAADRIDSDQADRKTDQHRDEAAQERIPGQAHRDDQPEERETEVLGSGEAERDGREDRCEKRECAGREQAADARRNGGDADGAAGFPLLRHRIAIEQRRRSGGRSGGADQDRGDATRIDAGRIDGEQHHDPGDRLHGEGERNQERDRHRCRKARNGADDDPHHRSRDQEGEHLRTGDGGEARQEQLCVEHVGEPPRLDLRKRAAARPRPAAAGRSGP